MSYEEEDTCRCAPPGPLYIRNEEEDTCRCGLQGLCIYQA